MRNVYIVADRNYTLIGTADNVADARALVRAYGRERRIAGPVPVAYSNGVDFVAHVEYR